MKKSARTKATQIGKFFLILILAFAFFTRVWHLNIPDRYIFDEVYHVVTVKLMAANDPRAFEWWHGAIEPNTAIDWLHPPLAKYTQALFVRVFGSSSFSWRISSALFGVGVVWLTYKLSFEFFRNERLSLWAALLASLDGLLLVQSRITMNDVHVTFFILLTCWMYLLYRKKEDFKHLLWVGLSAGLAMGSKWSGLLILLTLLAIEFFRLARKQIKKFNANKLFDQLGQFGIALILLPAILYVLSYSQMFLQGKGWDHFRDLHWQIWNYQTTLEATHTYQSRPMEWFLNIRPVWFHVTSSNPDKIGNIYTVSNPLFAWFGAGAVIWSLMRLIWEKYQLHKKRIDQKLVLLLCIYFGVWLPWQLSPRIMFHYHYLPAIPLLAIILAYWLDKIWQQKNKGVVRWNRVLVVVVLLLVATNFAIWYPHWTAIEMPKEFVNQVYFALPGWK